MCVYIYTCVDLDSMNAQVLEKVLTMWLYNDVCISISSKISIQTMRVMVFVNYPDEQSCNCIDEADNFVYHTMSFIYLQRNDTLPYNTNKKYILRIA